MMINDSPSHTEAAAHRTSHARLRELSGSTYTPAACCSELSAIAAADSKKGQRMPS